MQQQWQQLQQQQQQRQQLYNKCNFNDATVKINEIFKSAVEVETATRRAATLGSLISAWRLSLFLITI